MNEAALQDSRVLSPAIKGGPKKKPLARKRPVNGAARTSTPRTRPAFANRRRRWQTENRERPLRCRSWFDGSFLGWLTQPTKKDLHCIHRQGIPILQSRRAVFYNYHDPEVPLQQEDVEYYRYHPLLRNAAFLGGLTLDQQRILGFGNQTHYQPHSIREPLRPGFHRFVRNSHAAQLHVNAWSSRIFNKLRRVFLTTGR